MKPRSGARQSQNLKGEEDQELIRWIASQTNASPAPATKSKRRGISPAFFYITVLWPESLQPSTLATFVWVASCRSGRELEKLGQAQDLKGAEDQELIQWINSPTNGSPAPATK